MTYVPKPQRWKRVVKFPAPGVCGWCGKALEGRRTSWCSDACSTASDRASGLYVRSDALRANRQANDGALRCATCRVVLVGTAEGDLERAGMPPYPECPNYARLGEAAREAHQVRKAAWEKRCAALAPEVDHVVALALGGDLVDIANLQVLCPPCHKKKTAADAAAIAVARRRAHATKNVRELSAFAEATP